MCMGQRTMAEVKFFGMFLLLFFFLLVVTIQMICPREHAVSLGNLPMTGDDTMTQILVIMGDFPTFVQRKSLFEAKSYT